MADFAKNTDREKTLTELLKKKNEAVQELEALQKDKEKTIKETQEKILGLLREEAQEPLPEAPSLETLEPVKESLEEALDDIPPARDKQGVPYEIPRTDTDLYQRLNELYQEALHNELHPGAVYAKAKSILQVEYHDNLEPTKNTLRTESDAVRDIAERIVHVTERMTDQHNYLKRTENLLTDFLTGGSDYERL